MQAYKNAHNNWEVETRVKLDNNYILRVVTSKRSSGELVTTALACKEENGFMVFRMGRDFSSRVMVTRPNRITKGVVEKQHAEAYSSIQELIDAANKYQESVK